MYRVTPKPRLVSLVPDQLTSGSHSFREAASKLLLDPQVESVDLVSYCIDYQTLEDLSVLRPRSRTRVLIVPPGGVSYVDALALSKAIRPGLEIREVDRTKVPEVVHLKILIMKFSNGKTYVITGSSNFTVPGTGDAVNANSECSVLFEARHESLEGIQGLFDQLWEKGSRAVDPSGYLTKTSEQAAASVSFALLEFQEVALRKIKEEYQLGQGSGGLLLSLPTGSGKTTIAVRFLLDTVLTDPSAEVLWIAPHCELLFQAASTFESMKGYFRYPGLRVPTEGEVETSQEGAQVKFRTTTAAYLHVRKESPRVVVVDEAHHGAAMTRKMLPDIKEKFAPAFFLGLTGTPFRRSASENRDLKQLFGVTHREARGDVERTKNALGQPVLAIVDAITVKTGFSIRFDEATLEAHELDKQSLSSFNKPERNLAIAECWRPSYGPTLAFAWDIDHANELAKALRDAHPAAQIQVVHSASIPAGVPSKIRPKRGEPLTREQRRQIHELVRQGQIDIVVAVNMYSMGVDFPKTETLLMARPTLSPVLYSQMLGRGLRGPAFGGTERIRVIDFADQIETHDHLKKRLMSYQLERKNEIAIETERKLARSLWRKTRTLSCSKATEELKGCAGVYRVISKAGQCVDRRGWKWVSDLGRIALSGRRSKALHGSHRIQYLALDEGVGRRAASRLRLAEDLGVFDQPSRV